MKITLVALACLVAAVSADVSYLPPSRDSAPAAGYPSGGGGGYQSGRPSYGAPQADEQSGPAKYEFSYQVNDAPSGNDFGHKESRDGDVANGVYYVALPDGRKQMVEYVADQAGYRPQVTYQGEAKYGPPAGGPLAGGPSADTGAGGYRY
ncbi:pro-resilin-like [Bacillus rossius redtenbacheri]|uniref:pro-resilin-like n=1 Tax=Bacillus rossius redtenbacheri TaxID=93214 RepID=UPI002FDD1688